MILKRTLISIAATCALLGCSKTEAPRASATENTEIALSDVPQSVSDVVMAARTDFTMTEVVKKVRDGRVYYDVEGELPGGDEIEFDVLMTEQGPQIVEVQRDMAFADVPQNAREITTKANTDGLEIVRVIESVQTDESIIYEVFVKGHPGDPRFEVRVQDGQAELLASRWKH